MKNCFNDIGISSEGNNHYFDVDLLLRSKQKFPVFLHTSNIVYRSSTNKDCLWMKLPIYQLATSAALHDRGAYCHRLAELGFLCYMNKNVCVCVCVCVWTGWGGGEGERECLLLFFFCQ